MRDTELRTDKNYIEPIEEKSDENMKYVSSRIEAIEDKEIESFDEIDEITDRKMLAFAQRLDEEYERRHKKKKLTVRIRRCVAAIICVGIIGIIAIPSVNAWKDNPKGLTSEDKGDSLQLQYGSSTEVEGLEGYYTFSEPPKGYDFEEAEDNGFRISVIFSDGNGSNVLINSFTSDSTVNLNKDGATCKEAVVRGNEGYLVSREDENSKFVIWAEDSSFIQIQSDGPAMLSDEELLDLAEGVKLVR